MACLDAGASTGGFTDVLLSRGARIVYAVDVGRAQLLDRLRRDPRVVSMERTNLRDAGVAARADRPCHARPLASSACAWSCRRCASLLADDGRVVALVKPQFEAGREDVPRGGVVRDAAIWKRVLRDLARDAVPVGPARPSGDPLADHRRRRQRRVPGRPAARGRRTPAHSRRAASRPSTARSTRVLRCAR